MHPQRRRQPRGQLRAGMCVQPRLAVRTVRFGALTIQSSAFLSTTNNAESKYAARREGERT